MPKRLCEVDQVFGPSFEQAVPSEKGVLLGVSEYIGLENAYWIMLRTKEFNRRLPYCFHTLLCSWLVVGL